MAQSAARTHDDEPSHANRPADEVRIGNVKIAIWRNAGEKGDFYSAGAPQLSYKDDEGNWKDGKNYGAMDLLALSKATWRPNALSNYRRRADRLDSPSPCFAINGRTAIKA